MFDRRQFMLLAAAGVVGAAGIATVGFPLLTGCAATQSDGTLDPDETAGSPSSTDTPVLSAQPATVALFLFDTVIEIRAYCEQALVDEAARRCEFFERSFSRTKEGSDIHTLNNAAGAPVTVQPETAQIISQALAFCKESDGLFDITIGAVTPLWDFVEGTIPDPAVLAEAVTHIDYRTVRVSGNTVTLDDPRAALDLGGIAKGFIADDIARLLREGGCTSGLINLGGNVYALGSKPDGSPWNVGIQDPNATSGTVVARVEAIDHSVVTSGMYERSFERDGVLYHHILDPQTGYPVSSDLKSTTIISQESIDGDAFSTIAFLMGKDKAYALLEESPDKEGILVDDTGQLLATSKADYSLL